MSKPRPQIYNIKDGVTQSMLRDFLSCRKRMEYQLNGWQSRGQKAALRFGSLVHNVLEQMYKEIRKHQKKADLLGVMRATVDKEIDNTLKRTPDPETRSLVEIEAMKAKAVLTGYVAEWQDDLTRKWIGVENKFKIDFHGFLLRGMMDGVFEDKRGGIWLLETKTKSRIDAYLEEKLAFDFQCLYYLTALKQTLPDPSKIKGTLYNIIRTPQLRQKKGESDQLFLDRIAKDVQERPDHYFYRLEIHFPSEVQDEFERELLMKLEEYKMWLNGELPTYKREESCCTFWPCEFVGACAAGNMAGYDQTRIMFRELLNEEELDNAESGKKGNAAKAKKAKRKRVSKKD